jgi:hypothetical protein
VTDVPHGTPTNERQFHADARDAPADDRSDLVADSHQSEADQRESSSDARESRPDEGGSSLRINFEFAHRNHAVLIAAMRFDDAISMDAVGVEREGFPDQGEAIAEQREATADERDLRKPMARGGIMSWTRALTVRIARFAAELPIGPRRVQDTPPVSAVTSKAEVELPAIRDHEKYGYRHPSVAVDSATPPRRDVTTRWN